MVWKAQRKPQRRGKPLAATEAVNRLPRAPSGEESTREVPGEHLKADVAGMEHESGFQSRYNLSGLE